MDHKTKIHQFRPREDSSSHSEESTEAAEFEEFENSVDSIEAWDAWCEADYYLLEEEDYAGLIEHRRARAERRPDDPYAQSALGQAYVLNGEYQKAIDFLSDHYRGFPENTDYEHTILDALFALGRDENDFDWVEKPVVVRLTQEVLDACYDYLKPKRKPRSGGELYLELITKGYLLFDERQLIEALKADERFSTSDESGTGLYPEFTVVRRSRKRGSRAAPAPR